MSCTPRPSPAFRRYFQSSRKRVTILLSLLAVTTASHGVIFQDGFEGDSVGEFSSGTRGWGISGGALSIVSSATAPEGNQFLRATGGTGGDGVSLERSFSGTGSDSVVWIELYHQVRFRYGAEAEAVSGNPVASAFFFTPSGQLRVLDGNGDGTGNWETLTNYPPLAEGSWARITVRHDYANQRYTLWLNGAQVAENFGFLDPVAALSRMRIDALSAIDGVAALRSEPAGLNYDWTQATEIIPGVRHAKFSVSSPRLMAINIARIDMHNPDLRFYTTPRASNWQAGTRETLRRRTTGFVSDARNAGKPVVLAINGDFFTPTGGEGGATTMLGVSISDGVVVSPLPTDRTRPAFVFFKDWTADLVGVNGQTDISNFLQAINGNTDILVNNVPVGSTSGTEPRTALAVSFDRRYVYWLTIDGRRGGHSDGATIRDLGEFMQFFGAFDGVNLDGGGSTTMVQWNGSPQILNVPSDQNTFLGIPIGGSVERAVGNHIGVYAITSPEQVPATDWLAARGVPAGQRGLADDPNDDGITNLEAYAFNIHPMDPEFPYGREALPQWGWDGNELRYTIRRNRHATGLNFFFEYSRTLQPGEWSTLPGSATEFLSTPDSRTGDTFFRTSLLPGSQPKEFLRLRIEGP